jgi:signal transduction histidine kinase
MIAITVLILGVWFQHLIIWIRIPSNKVEKWFLVLTSAILAHSTIGVINYDQPNFAQNFRLSWWHWLLEIIACWSFLRFIVEFCGFKLPRGLKVADILLAIALGWHILSPFGMAYQNILGLKERIITLGKPQTVLDGEFGPGYAFLILATLFVLFYGLYAANRLYNSEQKSKGLLLFSSILIILSGIFLTVIKDFGLVNLPGFIDHSFVAMIMIINFSISDEIILNASLKEQISQSESQIRAMANSSPGILFRAQVNDDNDYKFVFISDSVTPVLGLASDPVVFQWLFSQKIHPQDLVDYKSKKLEALQNQKPVNFEGRYLHPNGNTLWIRFYSNPEPPPNQHFHSGFILDISDLKKLEIERELFLKELKLRNEELESLIYTASHDLRSPIVNINGFCTELEHDLKLLDNKNFGNSWDQSNFPIIQSNLKESLTYIKKSVKRLYELIESILQLTRAGQAGIKIQICDVNAIIHQQINMFKHIADEFKINFVVGETPRCMADPSQLGQVFSNLIDNSIKYRKPNVECIINIFGKASGDEVIYHVIDNGTGFDQVYSKRIFEIFHRLNPESSIGGEGIGLTLVRRFLLRMHGEIAVKSSPGVGTEFFVTLPAAPHSQEALIEKG